MKKILFILAALLVAGAGAAMAQGGETPNTDLSSIVTTSDDVQIISITNDEVYPWVIEDGAAKSTNGKVNATVTAGFTIKFSCEGRAYYKYTYSHDGWNGYDSRRVYLDNVQKVNTGSVQTSWTTNSEFIIFEPGEHELRFELYHNYWTDAARTQVFAVKDIEIYTAESQYVNIELSEAGTLGVEALSRVSTLPDMHYLRLTGSLNANDWSNISKMTGLYGIDLRNTTVTDIPANAFVNCPLRYLDLPTGLKTIGEKAFYDRYLTGALELPNTLESIDSYAFYRNNITEVTFPASLTSVGTYAFEDNNYLTSVTFGGGLKEVPNYMFEHCDILSEAHNCAGIETVGSYAFCNCPYLVTAEGMQPLTVGSYGFQACRRLADIDLSKTTSISNSAFNDCDSLKTLDLASLTTLGNYAFDYCDGLTSVRFNDKITTIPNGALRYCSNLEEIVLGSSVRTLNGDTFYCNPSKIKRVYVNAPAPPTVNSSPFYTRSGITLYVPEYAMMSYKLDSYWSQFTSVEANPNPVSEITLYGNLELASNVRIPGSPDITMGYSSTNSAGSSFVVNGNNAQALGDFAQVVAWGTYSPSLISRCNAMTSTSSTVRFHIPNASTYWYYVTMPYDVQRSAITATDDAAFAVRYYDGASRASSGASGSWTNVGDDATLKAGQGYIFCASKACYIWLPAVEGQQNKLFTSTAINTPLVAHTSTVSNDADWNLVGNPYPAFYDIYYMDYTAPITVWNTTNKTYTAYSVADDNLALYPLQAFFVQKPDQVDAIAFQTAGRQISNVIDHSAATRSQKAGAFGLRSVINITLSDGAGADRTRIVVNPADTDDFCADTDASKMLANEGTPQIYTLRGEDIYAINEGPQADGTVTLGLILSADGTYTLDLERADIPVTLLDGGAAVEMPYTFQAEAGTLEGRFMISLPTTGLTLKTTDNGQQTTSYDLTGRRVKAEASGVSIQNGKKVIK